tara:strand:- start:383 stop:1249 length:867 start_codon:yes stop_codon:yes gene_type:complete
VSITSPRIKLSEDLKVLWHLLLRPVRGHTHAERLESFYRGQADSYDSFRSRLLHGRERLIGSLEFPDDGVWVDMGAGTGENVVFAGDSVSRLRAIHLVDLAPSLLEVAQRRMQERAITQARVHLCDATQFELPPASVDVITFSYSLTMIPDWFEAILVAQRLLKPGGTIAVVDFTVSRKFASAPQRQHHWCQRTFWTHWFAFDNVFLTPDHLAMLTRLFQTERLEQSSGRVPYLPLLRAPFYLFVGRKSRQSCDPSSIENHVFSRDSTYEFASQSSGDCQLRPGRGTV